MSINPEYWVVDFVDFPNFIPNEFVLMPEQSWWRKWILTLPRKKILVGVWDFNVGDNLKEEIGLSGIQDVLPKKIN